MPGAKPEKEKRVRFVVTVDAITHAVINALCGSKSQPDFMRDDILPLLEREFPDIVPGILRRERARLAAEPPLTPDRTADAVRAAGVAGRLDARKRKPGAK